MPSADQPAAAEDGEPTAAAIVACARGAVVTGRLGHNGGPALEGPTDIRPGQCRHCRHWKAPSEGEQQAYEAVRCDQSRRRVRRPTGSCDRVLIGNSRVPVFSATVGEFGCRNFEAAPSPPMPKGGGYVTIWQNGRIAWQGREEEIPARFLQEGLSLSLRKRQTRSAQRIVFLPCSMTKTQSWKLTFALG